MQKKLRLVFYMLVLCQLAMAQLPVAKIDLNMEGRTDTEVNETGYTSWTLARVHSASKTVSGITFTLTAIGPTNTSTFRAGWSKLLVQSPNFMRLVNDGIKVDNDTMLLNPTKVASVELRISGLAVGKHTIQTYHNIWEDTTSVKHCPINVYVNGTLTHNRIIRSVQVKSNSNATRLLSEVEITQAGQEAVLVFEGVTDYSTNGKKADYNVIINAIELNTDDASKQAYDPTPTSGNLHVDADSGSFKLKWNAAKAGGVVSHNLYFGTDSLKVANATGVEADVQRFTLGAEVLEQPVSNLWNLNTYYWRVDETDNSGTTTKGRIWNFRPRHLAFRGAEGYGRFATGGRKGKVVFVTNLNDSGEGSFRQAATSGTGPRTIIFNVSGIIPLNSKIFVDPFVTIAGQTAPGKGVCFRTSSLGIGSENICRFVRMRLGSGTSTDGMGLAGAFESIIDHSSISWSIDEGFSSRNAKNITFQRNIISEALNVAGLDNYSEGHAHGYAAVIGGDIASFHHNLIAHCYGRNPRMDGGIDGSNHYAGRLDIFNNVIYNWMISAAYGEAHEANFVNNYYKQGPATDKTLILAADINQRQTNLGTETYYVSGNMLELKNKSFYCDGTVADCGITTRTYGTMDFNWTFLVDKPFYPSYAKIESAKFAFRSVLSDAGCIMPVFDDHDKRVVNETLNGTYTYTGSITQKGGIIDTETDAGGYEDYPVIYRSANFDTDMDGLPDWWENLHGFNPNSTSGSLSDTNSDSNHDGYTALEEYLEWMAVPHYYIESTSGEQLIDLQPYMVGYTKNPVYNISANSKLNITLNGNIAKVSPVAGTSGIQYFDFTVTDSEGASYERRLGICVGVSPLSNLKSVANERAVNIYPSLFSSEIHIDVLSQTPSTITVKLCNLQGQCVLKTDFTVTSGKNNFTLKGLMTLQQQMYILEVVDKESARVLFKQKVVRK